MTGRKPTISDGDILRVVSASTDPYLTTTEIAEEIGLSQPGTLKRLRDLEESDLLANKKAGNSNTWWLTEEGREFLAADVEE